MPAAKVCPTIGCPELQPCTTHRRPGPRQRGYTTQHDRLRRHYAVQVEAGGVTCWRCGQPIQAGTPWDLGHHDDRTYAGPEHAACNRAAAGRASHEA
jgi:hypothetical protein